MHELSAELVFHCPSFQHPGLLVTSAALSFPCIQLLPQELLPSWAPAVLGLFRVEVVSARLNPSHST